MASEWRIRKEFAFRRGAYGTTMVYRKPHNRRLRLRGRARKKAKDQALEAFREMF